MDQREKMICSILLLISLTSCVSGSFVVNVTQTSYQAEKDQDITLEWTFPTRTSTSSRYIAVHCEVYVHNKPSVLFYLKEGAEVPESQDEQFAGRVRCDEDILREGRLRLYMSRLKISDSGLYVCKVHTTYGTGSGRCDLNVTATDETRSTRPPESPQPESPQPESLQPESPQPESPQPESRGRISLYVGLTAGLCAGLFFIFRLWNTSHSKTLSHQRSFEMESYEAEENGNITVEWTLTTTTHISPKPLLLCCYLLTELRPVVLFDFHDGVEVPESQDEQFAGRVQFDKDVLREGRLRLNVSRLRINDSGLYSCDALVGQDRKSERFCLNVTAVREKLKPEGPEASSPPQPESRGWIRHHGQGVSAAAVLLVLFTFSILVRRATVIDRASAYGSEEPV